MGGAVVILLFLPFINTSEVRSSTFRPLYRKLFWFIFSDFLLLGWARNCKTHLLKLDKLVRSLTPLIS